MPYEQASLGQYSNGRIQKIPPWSEIIKKRWDENQGLKLIVTGSSSFLVEKGLKETLAGRFEMIRAEHWNYYEANQSFDISLDEYVEYGCYPGTIRFLKDFPRWGNYVRDAIIEPALGRDLLQLHPVENPALLRQIFLRCQDRPHLERRDFLPLFGGMSVE